MGNLQLQYLSHRVSRPFMFMTIDSNNPSGGRLKFYYETNFQIYIEPQKRLALSLDIQQVQREFVGSIKGHITFSNQRPKIILNSLTY